MRQYSQSLSALTTTSLRNSPGYKSGSWRETLPGASLCQSHQMFELEVMVELRTLFRAQASRLLAGEHIQDVLTTCLRRLERRYAFRGRPGGDEIDKLVVCPELQFSLSNSFCMRPQLSSVAFAEAIYCNRPQQL